MNRRPADGGELASITYRRTRDKARRTAPGGIRVTAGKARYDWQQACVSTWLNGGIPPARIAEWAGHSVAVLPKIYAKCIHDQDHVARAAHRGRATRPR